jgi:hypothetical protein
MPIIAGNGPEGCHSNSQPAPCRCSRDGMHHIGQSSRGADFQSAYLLRTRNFSEEPKLFYKRECQEKYFSIELKPCRVLAWHSAHWCSVV